MSKNGYHQEFAYIMVWHILVFRANYYGVHKQVDLLAAFKLEDLFQTHSEAISYKEQSTSVAWMPK